MKKSKKKQLFKIIFYTRSILFVLLYTKIQNNNRHSFDENNHTGYRVGGNNPISVIVNSATYLCSIKQIKASLFDSIFFACVSVSVKSRKHKKVDDTTSSKLKTRRWGATRCVANIVRSVHVTSLCQHPLVCQFRFGEHSRVEWRAFPGKFLR